MTIVRGKPSENPKIDKTWVNRDLESGFVGKE
jgi:hypothetical protein